MQVLSSCPCTHLLAKVLQMTKELLDQLQTVLPYFLYAWIYSWIKRESRLAVSLFELWVSQPNSQTVKARQCCKNTNQDIFLEISQLTLLLQERRFVNQNWPSYCFCIGKLEAKKKIQSHCKTSRVDKILTLFLFIVFLPHQNVIRRYLIALFSCNMILVATSWPPYYVLFEKQMTSQNRGPRPTRSASPTSGSVFWSGCWRVFLSKREYQSANYQKNKYLHLSTETAQFYAMAILKYVSKDRCCC